MNMQKIIIPLIIFIAVLIALMFGEGLLSELLNLLEEALEFLLNYWRIFYTRLTDFIISHPYKLLLAILITLIASLWVFKHHNDEIHHPANRRKFSIILAIFLGWLGIHRFYLGQYTKAAFYLLPTLLLFAAPLSLFFSLIDAARFLAMSDEEFQKTYPSKLTQK